MRKNKNIYVASLPVHLTTGDADAVRERVQRALKEAGIVDAAVLVLGDGGSFYPVEV
ncbi:MAG: hypothetical protein WC565_08060 [Parcubacteria group bacterium]|jgi:hypothetical protein